MSRKTLLIILLTAFLLSTSCMKSKKEDSTKLIQKEKAPKSLVTVMEEIDEVLVSMDQIEKTLKLSPAEFEIQEMDAQTAEEETEDKSNDGGDMENQQEDDEEQDEEKNTDGGKTEDKTEGKSTVSKDDEVLKLWKTIDGKVEKIHKNWNNYETEGIKKGANAEKSRELKKDLNLLTEFIEKRNIVLAMDNGSKALYSLSYFFDLYKDEIYGDLSKIRYATYQAYLNAKGKNVQEADNFLGTTEEYITRIRQRLDEDKDKIKSLDKLSLSIEDMKQSLTDDSVKLWEIKKDIILENIKELQD